MLETPGREEMFLHLVTSPVGRKGRVAGTWLGVQPGALLPACIGQAAVGVSTDNLWEPANLLSLPED